MSRKELLPIVPTALDEIKRFWGFCDVKIKQYKWIEFCKAYPHNPDDRLAVFNVSAFYSVKYNLIGLVNSKLGETKWLKSDERFVYMARTIAHELVHSLPGCFNHNDESFYKQMKELGITIGDYLDDKEHREESITGELYYELCELRQKILGNANKTEGDVGECDNTQPTIRLRKDLS